MRKPLVQLRLVIILAVASSLLARAVVFPAFAMRHNTHTNGDYTVYLPIISKPPCEDFSASLYSAASKAVLTAGETITVTGVLVNDGCARLGAPYFGIHVIPTTIMTPSESYNGYFLSVQPGSFQETRFVLQAMSAGPVTVTMGVSYEILGEGIPPGAVGGRAAHPLLIRVVPISPTTSSVP